MHPRTPLAFLATRARCWLMVNLSSTSTPRSLTSVSSTPARLHQAFHQEQCPYPFLMLPTANGVSLELQKTRFSSSVLMPPKGFGTRAERWDSVNEADAALWGLCPQTGSVQLDAGANLLQFIQHRNANMKNDLISPTFSKVSKARGSRQVNVRPTARSHPQEGFSLCRLVKLIRNFCLLTHSVPRTHNSAHTVQLAHLCNLYCTQHPKTRGILVW